MLNKKTEVPGWESPYNPLSVEQGYEVITLYMLTYGTLTHTGGNAKHNLTDFGATYLGTYKLPQWAFTGKLAAGFIGSSDHFIVVDLWALAGHKSNSEKDLLDTWQASYSVACLEGQRVYPYERRHSIFRYMPGLLKIAAGTHKSITKDVYAKIYEVPYERKFDKIENYVSYKNYTEEELEQIPELPCLLP